MCIRDRPQIGHVVFARPTGGLDLALDAPFAKAAGHDDAADALQPIPALALLQIAGVDPLDLHLPVAGDAGVVQRLAHAHVGVVQFHVLADEGDADVYKRQGVGRYLKERNPDVQVIGVDPLGSILYELHRSGQYTVAEGYKVEGIGEDFLPTTTDLSVIDEIVQVNDRESLLMTRRLVREEGIFGGGSCGAAVAGALKYVQQNRLGPEAVVVIVLPDSGSRYLSKVFDDDWMRENGFLEGAWTDIRAGDVQSRKPSDRVYTARADDRLRDVVALMKAHNVSQLPVVDENGRLRGLVSEIDLLNHMLQVDHVHEADETIAEMIDEDAPVVGPNARLETLMRCV